MREIPLTQGKVTLVDDKDYEYLMQWKWYASKGSNTFYAARMDKINGKRTMISMHRQLMGFPIGMLIDHIDRHGLNNQRDNLRVVSKSENMRNAVKQKHNTTGFKGVSFYKKSGRFRATIKINGNQKQLGYFDDKKDAARAYDAAAIEQEGEYAYTNFKYNT